MGMVVTQLVFASTLSGDCETLHNRRKVMVRQAGVCCLIEEGPLPMILAQKGLHAVHYHANPAADKQIKCFETQLRESQAEGLWYI